MRSIIISICACVMLLCVSKISFAQQINTQKENSHDFKNFRLDFAGTGMRFAGKKEDNIQGSKAGFGGFIQPTFRITDQHYAGLKMLWSYHDEDPKLNHFSLLANYMFMYYKNAAKASGLRKFITFFTGAGAGITSGPGPTSNSITHFYPTKTSFALMPYAGLRWGNLFGDIAYHYAAGNKLNSFIGFSIGIMFNGGFRK